MSFWWRAYVVPISERWLVHEAFEPRFQIVRLLYTGDMHHAARFFPRPDIYALLDACCHLNVGRWIIAFTFAIEWIRLRVRARACVEAARKVNHALPGFFRPRFSASFSPRVRTFRSTPSHGRLELIGKGSCVPSMQLLRSIGNSFFFFSFQEVINSFFCCCALKSYSLSRFLHEL